jgi:hypothetical protein
MAIDIQAVRFLLASRDEGCSFNRVATLGRLHLAVYRAKLDKILKAKDLSLGTEEPETLGGQSVADPLFRALGTQQLDSIDYSNYQGATLIQDLNQPVPSSLHGTYDLVYDGGTLEHVFNFPTAIKNCMLMTKVGGRVVIHTMCNNFAGHGFYQFSPELFYRVFAPENGFEVERMVLHSIIPWTRWYSVADPAKVRKRVELLSFSPMLLLIRARKTRDCAIFSDNPAQADLESSWSEDAAAKAAAGGQRAAIESEKVRRKWNPRFALLARFSAILRNGFHFYTDNTVLNRKSFRPTKPGKF